MERHNSNNYQDKLIIKAHKLAEKMDKANVMEIGFGEFLVKSATQEKTYRVDYNELCEAECRTLYCKVCKVCIHRYRCECPQHAIRTTHSACMFEQRKRSDSVLGDVTNMLGEVFNKYTDRA